MRKTVEVGTAFFNGLAANRDAKFERKSENKREAAADEIASLNLENCNTMECNEKKADIYYTNAYADGFLTYNLFLKAREFYAAAANQGSVYAIEKMLTHYGRKEDKFKAPWVETLIEIYSRSANAGSVQSMYKLATVYDNPDRFYSKETADDNKAIYWYERAATANHILALERLIEVYRSGELGQRKDYAKGLQYALSYYNHPNASFKDKLAVKEKIVKMYEKGGHGIDKNTQLAKEWDTRTPDFIENFIWNTNNWPQASTNNYVAKLVDGKYILNLAGGAWVSTIPIAKYQGKNFEVTSLIKKTGGDDAIPFGVLLGGDKKNENYHFLCVTGTGEFGLIRYEKKAHALIAKTTTAFKKGSDYNRITLKKIDSTFKIYLNNVFVAESPAQNFFGDQFGFVVWGKGQFFMEVDDFVIREIKPGDNSINNNNTGSGTTATTNTSASFFSALDPTAQNMVFDVTENQLTAGSKVILWKKHGGENQKFYYDPLTKMIHLASNPSLVLDAAINPIPAKKVESGDIILWNANKTSMNQQWELIITNDGHQFKNAYYSGFLSFTKEQNSTNLKLHIGNQVNWKVLPVE